MSKVTKKCVKCHRAFQYGHNRFSLDNKPLCDKCAGVKRDLSGYAWLPGETEHTYQVIATGEIYTQTRTEAFGG